MIFFTKCYTNDRGGGKSGVSARAARVRAVRNVALSLVMAVPLARFRECGAHIVTLFKRIENSFL